MNPLTQEQVNIAKNFTDQQKKSYSQLRTNGVEPQEAFSIVAKAYSKVEEKDPTLAEGLKGAVKEVFTGGIRRTEEISQKYGNIEALRRLPLSFLAGAGSGVAQGVGSVLETIDDKIGIGEAINPYLERAVSSDTGQKIISGLSEFDEQTKGVAGDLFDASSLLGLGSLKSAPAKTLKQKIAKVVTKTEITPTAGVSGVSTVIESAPAKATVGKKLKEVIKKPFTGTIETPADVISPENFQGSISRGFTPQDARVFANIGVKDKPIVSEMLQLADDISLGKADINRKPIDIVGKNIEKRIRDVEKIEKELGKNVDEVAKGLQSQKIDENKLKEKLTETIEGYKINRTDKGWDFEDSDFALTKNVQGDIKEALDYVFSPKKDAYSVHRIKKTLDGLLYPQKTTEGLSGSAKNLIKKLRKDVDDYLDETFDSYRVANEEYSTIRKGLDKARDSLGSIDEANLAQKIRQVFSNSPKRNEFKDAIQEIQNIAKQRGLEDIGNIYNQALFAEKLIDIFGDNAVTGFGPQITRAISKAQSIATGLKNPIQGIGTVAGEVVERIAKQRPEDRIQFLKDIVK